MTQMIKENKILQEKIYVNALPSGVKCYIIPRYGYAEKMAAAVFNFGSRDIRFKWGGEKEVPAGTAHFLEHKLFENEDGNAFDKMVEKGAVPNAFTDTNKTAYHFSTHKEFNENYKLLLDFISRPYFSEESVEREKSIIKQEIAMCRDDPGRRAFVNLLGAMYKNHPIRIDIAGDEASVESITCRNLYDCYRAFYMAQNMSVVCVGDIDPQWVWDRTERMIRPGGAPVGKKLFPEEPEEVSAPMTEAFMDMGRPIMNFGFKEKPSPEDLTPKKIFGTKVLFDLAFGGGSPFFEKMYEKELLSEPMSFQYMSGEGYSAAVIGGQSRSPLKVREALLAEIERLSREGFPEKDFKRIIKKHMGRFIRGFNVLDAIMTSQIDLCVSGADLFSALDAIGKLDTEYLEGLLRGVLRADRMAVSIVW